MMFELFVFIHLPEDCGRVIKSFHLPSYEERIFKGHRVVKRKLSPRKDANRNRSIFCRSKPARAGTKVACGEFVANLCGSRPYSLKAVVTHIGNSLVVPSGAHEILADGQHPPKADVGPLQLLSAINGQHWPLFLDHVVSPYKGRYE